MLFFFVPAPWLRLSNKPTFPKNPPEDSQRAKPGRRKIESMLISCLRTGVGGVKKRRHLTHVKKEHCLVTSIQLERWELLPAWRHVCLLKIGSDRWDKVSCAFIIQHQGLKLFSLLFPPGVKVRTLLTHVHGRYWLPGLPGCPRPRTPQKICARRAFERRKPTCVREFYAKCVQNDPGEFMQGRRGERRENSSRRTEERLLSRS